MNGIFFRWWVSFSSYFNPFVHEPPLRIHILSTASVLMVKDNINLSANLWRVKRSFKPYQNEHNSVKNTGEKGKKSCNIDLKISSDPKIPIAFLKTFPTKMKPTNAQQEQKGWGKKSEKEGRRESERKSQVTAVSLLNPKTILKFCFLCLPELRKPIFCIWIRRPSSVWPVKDFVLNSTTVTRKPLNKL